MWCVAYEGNIEVLNYNTLPEKQFLKCWILIL
jgi:hypothetical protein